MRARAESAVIEFPQARVRPAGGDTMRGPAQVLIFTGVRFERMFDLAERLPPARSRSGAARRGEAEFY